MKVKTETAWLRNHLAKHWITIWLVAVSLILISVICVWASYIDSNYKIKRVIAPAATTEGLFTSNYLKLGSSEIQSAYFDKNDNKEYSYSVIVRNYNPSDPGTIFESPIPYKFKVSLAHRNGTLFNSTTDAELISAMGNNTITISDGSNSVTLNSSKLTETFESPMPTLSSDHKIDTWTVTYNEFELGSDYCLKFEAIPQNIEGLDTLSATIIVAAFPVVHPEGWTCTIAEPIDQESDSSVETNRYDAFNYIISGTGIRTLEFKYDSTKLIVNPASYQFYSEVDAPVDINDRTNWKKIVIHANPNTTAKNRYDFQVYKVGGHEPSSFKLLPNKPGSYVEFAESQIVTS